MTCNKGLQPQLALIFLNAHDRSYGVATSCDPAVTELAAHPDKETT